MKNLGNALGIITIVLFLGHLLTSGTPFFSHFALKAVLFIVAILISAGVYFYAGKATQSPLVGGFAGGGSMLLLLLVVGALT